MNTRLLNAHNSVLCQSCPQWR